MRSRTRARGARGPLRNNNPRSPRGPRRCNGSRNFGAGCGGYRSLEKEEKEKNSKERREMLESCQLYTYTRRTQEGGGARQFSRKE